MKKLLAATLLAVPCSAKSLDMDVWSIISVTKFLVEQVGKEPPTQRVRVQVEADTVQSAQQGAWREACNQTWGSTVITDRSAVNGRLQTDRVASSSSCFVKNYSVINSDVLTNAYGQKKYRVEMDVTTSPNNIDGRLLGNSTDTKQLQGDQHQAAIQSLVQSRRSQDNLIRAYLNYYPEGAWDVEVKSVQSGVQNTQAFLRVTYEYKLSYKFMHGLWQVLDKMKVPPNSINVLDKRCFTEGSRYDAACNSFYSKNSAGVRSVKLTMRQSGHLFGESDTLTLTEANYQSLSNELTKLRGAVIQFNFKDAGGNVLLKACDRNVSMNTVMLQGSNTGLIQGDRYTQNVLQLNLNDIDLDNLKNYQSLEAKVSSTCY
jgi:hypothetical protein